MRVVLSESRHRGAKGCTPGRCAGVYKQLRFLADNIQHPSLRAKKYDEEKDTWQARVNRDWRFYFTIIGDTYRIEDVMPHPK
jgi:hypothetical protein